MSSVEISCAPRLRHTGQILAILGVNQTRFRRLARLGLLRQRPGGGYDPEDLRRDHALVCELEQRVAAVGHRLTSAERNGALAWLIEVARSEHPPDPAEPTGGLPARVADLLDCVAARR